MQPSGQKTKMELALKCEIPSSAAISGNRSVKRRLFSDDSPENLPPNAPPYVSIEKKLKEIFKVEKERALRVWGFDVTKDSPSTSSQFDWSATIASTVPNFYIRGSNMIATTPNSQSPPGVSSSSAIHSGRAAAETGTKNLELLTPATATEKTPTRNGAPKRKKSEKNKDSISRQVRLTEFYGQRKRPASAPRSPKKAKKRSTTGTNDSAYNQGDSSSSSTSTSSVFRP